MNTLTLNLRKSKRATASIFIAVIVTACASSQLPEEHHDRYSFPEVKVYIEEPTGKAVGAPYQILGWVRSKAEYPTMEQDVNNQALCKNYYNKAARELLKEAQKAGADSVIKVRSVVFMMDGKTEEYVTPECSDDGAQGEILLRGIAIKFLPPPKKDEKKEPKKMDGLAHPPAVKRVTPDPKVTPALDTHGQAIPQNINEKAPAIETD